MVITALSVPSVHTEALEVASKMGRISLFGGIAGDGKGYLDSNLIHYKRAVRARCARHNRSSYEGDYGICFRRQDESGKVRYPCLPTECD